MSTKVFVNLPVKNRNKSMGCFKALGWTFNPQFTDETAASLVISEDLYAMLLTHEKLAGFTNKKIADGTTVEALIAVAVDSKTEVGALPTPPAMRAANKPSRRRTMASCSYAAFSTLTATTGKSSTWTPPTCSPKRDLDAK
jgi:predicted lactoylglutathione lyase